jgi:hypothetical protein
VGERTKPPVLKTGRPARSRGFESRPLRCTLHAASRLPELPAVCRMRLRRGSQEVQDTGLLNRRGVHAPPRVRIPPSPQHAPVAQWIRALASGAKGHRFESCRAYQQQRARSEGAWPFCCGLTLRAVIARSLQRTRWANSHGTQRSALSSQSSSGVPAAERARSEGAWPFLL